MIMGTEDGTGTLANRLGGFGMLEGEEGQEFAKAVRGARAELNENMEERAGELGADRTDPKDIDA